MTKFIHTCQACLKTNWPNSFIPAMHIYWQTFNQILSYPPSMSIDKLFDQIYSYLPSMSIDKLFDQIYSYLPSMSIDKLFDQIYSYLPSMSIDKLFDQIYSYLPSMSIDKLFDQIYSYLPSMSIDKLFDQIYSYLPSMSIDKLFDQIYSYLPSMSIDKLFDQIYSYLPSMSIDKLFTYLLTYAHRSQWSIGHQRPPAIALCSGLLLSFRTSWSPAVSALLQCLASNCCEAGLSSSSPVGSRSVLGVWCWMLASWGCVRSSPTSSAVSAWPLVPVLLAPTVLHFGSSLAIGFCRCASDRCWRMSGSFVASSVLSAMSHIRRAGLTSHWSWRCGVWFSCWFLQMPRCFWAWQKLLLPCRFWLWRLGLCLPDGQPHFPDRRRTPPPLRALHQLWLVRWQLCSSSSAQSSFCWSWALSLLMWSPGEWSCPASGCDCVTGAPGHQRSRGHLAASRVSTVYRCSYLLLWSSWSSRWPGGRGTVKAGTPAGLQSSPRNFQTAGQRGQFCSSCPGRCTGWGRLSSWELHSVSVASTMSLCLHCQRPSHNLWSWCRGGSSTPVTVPRWCAGWRSGRHRICSAGSLPAGHGAWGRQPPSSSPVESCWEPCLALTGAWSLDSCCSP